MRFFTPNEKFFAWLQRVMREGPKVPVIDCGCGDGDLVLELRQRGVPAIGIDPMFDPLECAARSQDHAMTLSGAVMAMEAEQCSLVRNVRSILLTCRPCHSGFPQRINVARQKESRFFYIGLSKNVDADLGDEPRRRISRTSVGAEGEHIWEVSK